MQAGGQGARSEYESIASAAAFRKESGNTNGAASLRGIGDGWGQFGDGWDQFGDWRARLGRDSNAAHNGHRLRHGDFRAPRQADHQLGATARQRRLGAASGLSVAGAPAKAERLADAAWIHRDDAVIPQKAAALPIGQLLSPASGLSIRQPPVRSSISLSRAARELFHILGERLRSELQALDHSKIGEELIREILHCHARANGNRCGLNEFARLRRRHLASLVTADAFAG
jgi:hypothetical protein